MFIPLLIVVLDPGALQHIFVPLINEWSRIVA
jgi:hypothetical protein